MAAQFSQCPHCQAKMGIKNPDFIGKKVRCPACKEPFTVKLMQAAATAGAAKKSAAPTGQRAKPVARKPRPNDDEILEAEVVDDSAGEDDWLSQLDGLAPKGPAGLDDDNPAPARAGAAPRASGKKKKAAAKPKKRRKRRLRDPDGELPLWMSRLIMIGTGCLGGGLAAALWAGLAYKTESPTRFVALIVGACAGFGVRLGASKWDFGWFPAITASIIALAAIIGGKSVGVRLANEADRKNKELQHQTYIAKLGHADAPIFKIGEEIEDERADQMEGIPGGDEWYYKEEEWVEKNVGEDKKVDWNRANDPARFSERFGEQIWTEAKQRWDQMPEEQKAERRQLIATEIEERKTGGVEDYDDDFYFSPHQTKVLSIGDFFYAIFAVAAAFKIAAGMGGDEDDD
jgi:hypothetical protein